MRAIYLVVFLLVCSAASAEIYRWTDENGKVHFGDRVPEQYRTNTENLEVKAHNVLESDMKRGYVPREQVTQHEPGAVASQPPRRSEKAPPQTTLRSSIDECQNQWQSYYQSKACFDSCAIYIRAGTARNVSNCGHCQAVSLPTCPGGRR